MPIISPLLGSLWKESRSTLPYLHNHAREAVDFLGGLVSAQQSGTIDEKTVWLEVGPHPSAQAWSRPPLEWHRLPSPPFAAVSLATRRSRPASAPCTQLVSASTGRSPTRDFMSSVGSWISPASRSTRRTTGSSILATGVSARIAWPPRHPRRLSLRSRNSRQPRCRRSPPRMSTATLPIVETESEHLVRSSCAMPYSGHLVNGAPLCPLVSLRRHGYHRLRVCVQTAASRDREGNLQRGSHGGAQDAHLQHYRARATS